MGKYKASENYGSAWSHPHPNSMLGRAIAKHGGKATTAFNIARKKYEADRAYYEHTLLYFRSRPGITATSHSGDDRPFK